MWKRNRHEMDILIPSVRAFFSSHPAHEMGQRLTPVVSYAKLAQYWYRTDRSVSGWLFSYHPLHRFFQYIYVYRFDEIGLNV